jgi:hypothetical protein
VIAALPPEELAAVLAHERAHADGRHELVIQPFVAWQSALPFLAPARRATAAVAELVEMLADDAAAAKTSRLTVARALARVGAGRPPGIASPIVTPGAGTKGTGMGWGKGKTKGSAGSGSPEGLGGTGALGGQGSGAGPGAGRGAGTGAGTGAGAGVETGLGATPASLMARVRRLT